MKQNLKSMDIHFEREIRDPIYGYVYVTDFEDSILDKPIFQRLGRICQMPTAHVTYPSAKHTRKVHSLGTAHLMHRALNHLLFLQSGRIQKDISPLFWGEKVVIKPREENGIDKLSQPLRERWWNKKHLDEIIQSARLAGMLHDIGHAPFSHLFEDICKLLKVKMEFKGRKVVFNHELMSRKIIEEKTDLLGLPKDFTSDHVSRLKL